MTNRRGVTLLEATVAMAIVGLIAVAVLGQFSTELRVGARSSDARVLDALARDRLANLAITPTEVLARLPDSLAKGSFAPPFGDHSWIASVSPHRDLAGLLDVQVQIRSPRGQLTLATRFFRPLPRAERRP